MKHTRSLPALLLALVALPLCAEPDYLAELRQTARARQLAEHPYWHKLVHYRRNRLSSGVTSSVDWPDFFLAPEGKKDPAAELDATLASFFSTELRAGEPTQCRAKGRYEWLKAKLAFDPARLPEQRCEFHEEWLAAIRPAAISLVFAANDLNSPATMYGHTLLRVDGEGQGEDERLLARAVNYAAQVAIEGANVGHILQALVGGFYGEYSIYRYHERVRQYVRVNHRDLWEYPVRLSDEERTRVFNHLWEMRGVGSDYLFFTENCAFMLLSLLDTAREGLSLASEFDDPIPFVIPIDTVRVGRAHGVLDAPVFRPSMARTLAHNLEQLPDPAYDWALDYAAGDAGLDDPRYSGAAERDRARMLGATNDLLLFRSAGGGAKRDEYLPRSRAALVARSQLDARPDFSPVPVPATTPDEGHLSSRLAIGVRADEDHVATIVRARGAYHDRLDPTAGFLPGGEIEFVDLGLAIDDKVRVTDLKLVSVQSVAPWDRAFRPWLWQAQGGLRRFGLDALLARPQLKLGAYAEGGVGLAAGSNDHALAYAFAIAAVDANADLDQGHAVSAGTRTGLWIPWSNGFLQQLEIDALAPVSGGSGRQLQVRFGTHWQFTPRNGLRLLLNYGAFDRVDVESAELRWQHYF